MRHLPLLFIALAAWSACGQGEKTFPDRNWEGELRILPGDTAFMPCSAHRAYRVSGPGLDSLARRYAWLQTERGQWIKTWFSGHLAPGAQKNTDSVLVATAYQHMDAHVHCTPLPLDSLSGSYEAQAEVLGGTHLERLNFLPGGDAVIITSTPSLHAEVDGHWGLASDGRVVFEESGGHYSFAYRLEGGNLFRDLPNGQHVSYRRTGPADRMAGTFGRTARWLSAIAAVQGDTVLPGSLRPNMPLDSLFPQPGVRAALRSSAMDSLGLDEHSLAGTWDAASTVRDVAQLMRRHLQAAR
jgi:hypothetical protein